MRCSSAVQGTLPQGAGGADTRLRARAVTGKPAGAPKGERGLHGAMALAAAAAPAAAAAASSRLPAARPASAPSTPQTGAAQQTQDFGLFTEEGFEGYMIRTLAGSSCSEVWQRAVSRLIDARAVPHVDQPGQGQMPRQSRRGAASTARPLYRLLLLLLTLLLLLHTLTPRAGGRFLLRGSYSEA